MGHHDAERLADEIVNRGLNVRQVEAMARETGKHARAGATAASHSPERKRTPIWSRWKSAYPTRSALVVSIDDRGRGGVLSIRYRNLDQLDDVLRRLEKKR